jgi:signal transduction histidine kinase
VNHRWRFQGIITAITTGVVLVPLLLTGVLLWLLLSPGLERQQVQNQISLAQSVSAQISGFLENGVKEIELFAYYLRNEAEGASHTALSDFAILTEIFEVVYLVDEEGVVQQAGIPDSSDIRLENLDQLDISRMPHFKNLKMGMINEWSDAFLSSASGELVVAYSVTVSHGNHEHYLIAELGINSLPELLGEIKASSGLTVMILDEANQLIGHPDEMLSRQQINLTNLPLLDQPEKSGVRVSEFAFQEDAFYGALVSIPAPAWKIVAAAPVSQFWALLYDAIRSIAIALVFGVLTVIFISRWVVRRINKEFTSYQAVADRLARGDYEFKPPVSSIVELQNFSDNLIRTGQAIAHRETELANLNAELEARVSERTKDLVDANQNLNQTLSKLQHAQEELVESGKLAALGSLVAGVAHELNTPIGVSVTASTSVVVEARELSKAFAQGTLSRQHFTDNMNNIIEGSELISRNLSRAAELILSFKQVAVDQSSDKRRVFSLNEVVEDVLATMKPKYKGLNFEFTFRKTEDVELDSYPGSLIQVLTNLVDNAVVHGYERTQEGEVQISTKQIDDFHVEVKVADFGAGIKPEHKTHIFEPFFTTRFGSGGTGLGLNIVHSIVEKILGGQIKVQSQVGEGTAFVFTIPVKAPVNVDSETALLNS